MIRSRADYLEYLRADKIALQRKGSLSQRLFDDIWRFQRLLRRLEYELNTGRSALRRAPTQARFARLSRRLGFSIPPNVFGPGLSIAHAGTIVVNGGARVGANCRLHVCVNIGTEAGKASTAPTIGDNCYIGPGAKIFGGIRIGDGVAIGANAVVNKSFEEDGVTIAGVPAVKISEKGSRGLLVEGYRRGSAGGT